MDPRRLGGSQTQRQEPERQVSAEFADLVCEMLAPLGPVTARRMFGGHGLYLDGRMFGLIADEVLYFKTDDGNRSAYESAGMGPFKPFADKPMIMPYHEVPAEMLDRSEALCAWARPAIEAAARAAAAKLGRKRT